MQSLIGIAHPHVYLPSKRDALLFDRIGLIGFVRSGPSEEMLQIQAELEWLATRDVVFKVRSADFNDRIPADAMSYVFESIVQSAVAITFNLIVVGGYALSATAPLVREILLENVKSFATAVDVDQAIASAQSVVEDKLTAADIAAAFSESVSHATQKNARLFAQLLRIIDGTDAVPLSSDSPAAYGMTMGKVEAPVLDLVLQAFPTPDEDTPWEDVIAFRADTSAQEALRRLRRWVRKLTAESASPAEIRDELEGALDDYREFMRVHKIKTRQSTLRVVIATVAEAIEDIAKLRLSKLSDLIFARSTRRTNLLEAELKAPGREIAYIVKAESSFGRRGA